MSSRGLSVGFKIDTALQDALTAIGGEASRLRSLVVLVEDEVMRLHGPPLEATDNIRDDFAKLRDVLTGEKLEAAYLIVRLAKDEFAQISLCVEGVKPKVRILYSSGVEHFASVCGLQNPPRRLVRRMVERIEDICETLFLKETDSTRAELMTEEEKLVAAVQKLEVAPPVSVMPGVTVPLSEEGVLLLQRMCRGEVSCVTFSIEKETFTVDKSLETAGGDAVPSPSSLVDAAAALIPLEQPRVLLLRCGGVAPEAIVVNICPASSKPRERMLYSSCRASFVQQVQHHGVKCVRRMEVSDMVEFKEAVLEAAEEQRAAGETNVQ